MASSEILQILAVSKDGVLNSVYPLVLPIRLLFPGFGEGDQLAKVATDVVVVVGVNELPSSIQRALVQVHDLFASAVDGPLGQVSLPRPFPQSRHLNSQLSILPDPLRFAGT